MSEQDQGALFQNQFNNFAVNELYRICYKSLSKQSKNGPDNKAVVQCHSRITEAFKIVYPVVLTTQEE